MQQVAEAQADRLEVRPSRRRKTSERRKVTVRLSEGVSGRLDVASDRPGVGKSMLVEAALEHFLNPTPSGEAFLHERLDGIHARFDHLERDMRIIAETVALHARYHLTVVPPLPESRQREAVVLGDERFKVLAEQVDRRVRLGRPLMQETINRLNSAEQEGPGPTTGGDSGHNSDRARKNPNAFPGGVDLEQTPPASAKAARGNPTFAQHRKMTSRANASDEELNPRVTQNTDPKSATARLEAANEKPLSKWRLILSVFLPFAAGYYLSFLFRTINASISPILASDFGLGAAETGLLASVYFLVFAGAQIPIGVLLDRYGPRRVQSVLLVIAVGGISLFGNADSFAELLIGRAMIGLGVAAALMAGLKAIVIWFPRNRVAFVNGGMIMLGSLGAVTATAPTEWLLTLIGWRNLFELLTIATMAVAGLIYFAVPDSDEGSKRSVPSRKPLTLRSIFSDPRFLRIAPLSATCIGSSWAMHSLWAASWLADVEGFERQGVVNQLFTMAIGISVGALLLGVLADRLRKRGIATEALLAAFGALFILAEIAIILRVPLPSILPWSVVSVVGAGTVLSYAIIADYFPVEIAARANGALNLLHFGWAFAVQYGIGLIVNHWAPQDGHYPFDAYQTAFGFSLALQFAALLWFAVPWLRSFVRFISVPTDGQAVFVPTAVAEESVIEPSQGIEW
jgi:predicted MFS family arabinose efflux permease